MLRSFKRFIDTVLRGLAFVFAYMDDLLIASSSPEEHLSHLRQVFLRLAEFGIRVNTLNYVFVVSSLTFLGYLISNAGLAPLDYRVSHPFLPLASDPKAIPKVSWHGELLS